MQWAIIAFVVIMAVLALYAVNPFTRLPFSKASVFQPSFTIEPEAGKPIIFGVIGEGSDNAGVNDPDAILPLRHLISAIHNDGAKAVFLNGTLVPPIQEGVDKKGELISSDTLEKQLESILKSLEETVQGKLAFYPAISDKELAISNAPAVFKKVFRLDGAKIENGGLAYTIAIGPVLIAVIPTNNSAGEKGSEEGAISESTVKWLSKTFAAAPDSFRYRFVVGFEPAFPSWSTFMSQNVKNRDEFWKLLISSHVIAYFSSKEQLFDRSNRSGVWQVISGGGASADTTRKSKYPFIHALLITIPDSSNGRGGIPTMKIIDESGKVVDEFELRPHSEPLYQMRVS